MVSSLASLLRGQQQTTSRNEVTRSSWEIARAKLITFFHLILFAVGIALIALGRYNDAFITIIAALLSAIITTGQELRAKHQFDGIAVLVRPNARVLRDGIEQTVDATLVKAGDVVRLRAGDQAPADRGWSWVTEMLRSASHSSPVRANRYANRETRTSEMVGLFAELLEAAIADGRFPTPKALDDRMLG